MNAYVRIVQLARQVLVSNPRFPPAVSMYNAARRQVRRIRRHEWRRWQQLRLELGYRDLGGEA